MNMLEPWIILYNSILKDFQILMGVFSAIMVNLSNENSIFKPQKVNKSDSRKSIVVKAKAIEPKKIKG